MDAVTAATPMRRKNTMICVRVDYSHAEGGNWKDQGSRLAIGFLVQPSVAREGYIV